jgi:hypothetical protein
MKWLPIQYAGFHDVPLMFLVNYGGHSYVFDCEFNDEADEYEEFFVAYRLKKLMHRIEPSSWKDLPNAGERIGTVRVDNVRFDESMRKFIDASVFLLLPRVKKEDL